MVNLPYNESTPLRLEHWACCPAKLKVIMVILERMFGLVKHLLMKHLFIHFTIALVINYQYLLPKNFKIL